jgi:hypothetical protein
MSVRKLFFISVLLAAILSGPFAAAAVVYEATHLDRVTLSDPISPAMWSARSFLRYFDLFVALGFVPCALWVSSLRAPGANGRIPPR